MGMAGFEGAGIALGAPWIVFGSIPFVRHYTKYIGFFSIKKSILLLYYSILLLFFPYITLIPVMQILRSSENKSAHIDICRGQANGEGPGAGS
jgi:hypothetical protein